MAASTSANGNTSGAGSPPANEMTSGFSVSLSSSRMTELVIRCVRWAKRSLHRVGRAAPVPALPFDGGTAFWASISRAGIGMATLRESLAGASPPRKTNKHQACHCGAVGRLVSTSSGGP